MQQVILGQSRSLRKRNEDLVVVTAGLAPGAAGDWIQQLREQLVELVVMYVVLLLLYPEAVLLLTGLLALVISAAF